MRRCGPSPSSCGCSERRPAPMCKLSGAGTCALSRPSCRGQRSCSLPQPRHTSAASRAGVPPP
eukprot:5669499-Alexandrium_andersonii.AAC.1